MSDVTTLEPGLERDTPTQPANQTDAVQEPVAKTSPVEESPKATNGKKDSTIELPLFDLEEIVRVITKIHTDGLEAAKMDEVAHAFGYKSASSTPFYRRLVSARHFGLIVSNGVELTVRARDIIQPTEEGDREKALAQAATHHQYYAQWVSKLSGRRLNTELVSNDIERVYSVTKPCAKRCAEVLNDSLRFGGLMLGDGTVKSAGGAPTSPKSNVIDSMPEPVVDPDTQTHTLYLDRHKQRKFTMTAPISVTEAELQRICSWLGVTMIVDELDSP
ncbi:MAG: hypothetical protein JNM99_10095 [Verrucomicrobiaceae bacterium]|nr:hypothetical protein [Verrucomicrobiaceae bacterium]